MKPVMKKIVLSFLAAAALAAPVARGSNLLLNGDFNLANAITSSSGGENYGAPPDDWTVWTYDPSNAGVWANRQQDNTYSFDGSFYMGLGNFGGAGVAAGVYQIVSGSAGLTYDLSVMSGAQNWWWPDGYMSLIFLDGSSDILGQSNLDVTTGITAGDTGLPWQSYNVSATAPTGTTQVKAEFVTDYNTATGGGGTVFFDNAVLSVATVPEPSTLALAALGAGFFAMCIGRRYSNRGGRISS
jgi:hypothetical protein